MAVTPLTFKIYITYHDYRLRSEYEVKYECGESFMVCEMLLSYADYSASLAYEHTLFPSVSRGINIIEPHRPMMT